MTRPIEIYSAELSLATSATTTFSHKLLPSCELIKISNTGTIDVDATPRKKGGGDGSFDDTIVSGKTAGQALYAYTGANKLTITESGASTAKVIIKAYKYD